MPLKWWRFRPRHIIASGTKEGIGYNHGIMCQNSRSDYIFEKWKGWF